MCDGTNHNLVRIIRFGNEMEETVVRWCKDCGAIVVDVDYDGRTNPGRVMKMRFPTYKMKGEK
jgi:hypothetical protein